jgi:hypothetical protein
MQVLGGGARRGCLGGVLLDLAQLDDRDGQGDKVRDQRGRRDARSSEG